MAGAILSSTDMDQQADAMGPGLLRPDRGSSSACRGAVISRMPDTGLDRQISLKPSKATDCSGRASRTGSLQSMLALMLAQ